jgi:hypothetical protein
VPAALNWAKEADPRARGYLLVVEREVVGAAALELKQNLAGGGHSRNVCVSALPRIEFRYRYRPVAVSIDIRKARLLCPSSTLPSINVRHQIQMMITSVFLRLEPLSVRTLVGQRRRRLRRVAILEHAAVAVPARIRYT